MHYNVPLFWRLKTPALTRIRSFHQSATSQRQDALLGVAAHLHYLHYSLNPISACTLRTLHVQPERAPQRQRLPQLPKKETAMRRYKARLSFMHQDQQRCSPVPTNNLLIDHLTYDIFSPWHRAVDCVYNEPPKSRAQLLVERISELEVRRFLARYFRSDQAP